MQKVEIADILPENYPVGVNRPSIGCRGLVQRSLRLVTLIMRESYDWKENVRLHSIKLLYQFVLHAETAMTAKFFEIYPDLAKACSDSESNVASEVKIVLNVIIYPFIRKHIYIYFNPERFENVQYVSESFTTTNFLGSILTPY